MSQLQDKPTGSRKIRILRRVNVPIPKAAPTNQQVEQVLMLWKSGFKHRGTFLWKATKTEQCWHILVTWWYPALCRSCEGYISKFESHHHPHHVTDIRGSMSIVPRESPPPYAFSYTLKTPCFQYDALAKRNSGFFCMISQNKQTLFPHTLTHIYIYSWCEF